MSRRPVIVVISAIMLAIGGAFQLLSAAMSVVLAVIAPQMPVPTQPGIAAPPQAFLTIVMLLSATFYLALAGWAGTTAVGLLRMRRWARISMIVLGSALIVAGILGALSMAAVQFASTTMPMPPNADPRMLHVIFTVAGLFALILAVIGLWWVVYFALRRTRNLFQLAEADRLAASKGIAGEASSGRTEPYVAVANPYRSDLSTSGAQHSPYQPTYPTAGQATRSARPVSVTVIAVLMLIASVSALFQMLTPFPIFLFGALLSGWPAHLSMLVWCAVNGVAGLGLLKKERPAWMLAFGTWCLPVLNALTMLLPGARSRFTSYAQTIMKRSSFGLPQPQLPPQFMTVMAFVGVAVALLASGLVLTLLWRVKWAFEPSVEGQAAR